MNISDKFNRAITFYAAVILFFVTLPILLSYSLGYKIDYRKFKIYKTGIIYVNTRPSGASVYLNGKLNKNLTPAQIENLEPGRYDVVVKLENYYPWEGELIVRPNMVTKADRIELFPVSKEVKRLSKIGVKDFIVDDSGYVYYMTKDGLYVSATDGGALKKLSAYSNWPDRIIGKKISPDKNKFLYFDDKTVSVVYLTKESAGPKNQEPARVEEVFRTPERIMDVFWYPGFYYIVVVTEKDIKVIELRALDTRNIVSLYKFSEKPRIVYFDEGSNSLYFTDKEADADVISGKYLYRLDLRKTFLDSLRQLLIKEKPKDGNEEE